jgi:nitrogen fixation protein FixH
MTQTLIRKSDKYIPWYFVAFFVVLAILDGIFVYIATSTHTGVVTDNAYKKGLEYNQTIELVESQEKLGWKADIEFMQPHLVFYLKDKTDIEIKNAEVMAYISRVTQDGYDFKINLPYKENGQYSKNINFPLKGQWDISVVVKWNQQQYQKSKRIIVK